MPVIPFHDLPDDARLWVFAAAEPLSDDKAQQLLAVVDTWLSNWKAHGEPLACGRDWRDDRFLAVGVDQSTAGASGCSIDALFKVFQKIQSSIGTSMLVGGRVFYRDREGRIEATDRNSFFARAAAGEVGADTIVFDTSVTSAAAYRSSFACRAGESWHRDLLPAAARV